MCVEQEAQLPGVLEILLQQILQPASSCCRAFSITVPCSAPAELLQACLPGQACVLSALPKSRTAIRLDNLLKQQHMTLCLQCHEFITAISWCISKDVFTQCRLKKNKGGGKYCLRRLLFFSYIGWNAVNEECIEKKSSLVLELGSLLEIVISVLHLMT